MALAVVFAALVALASTVSAQNVGGASSFQGLAALLAAPCKFSYSSVGSTAGIAGFIAGTYDIGVSDDPMSTTDQSKSPKKLTLPLVISVYSFFINGIPDASAKLDAKQSFAIYSKAGKWDSYVPALKGKTIVPIGRSDSSGTTLLFKRFWDKSFGIYKTYKAITDDGSPLPLSVFPSLKTAAKSSGVCSLAGSTPGGICYAQIGICNSVKAGATGEVLMKNKAGKYVQPSASYFQGIIPRVLPAPSSGGWTGEGRTLLLANGPLTPPIGSFEYAFVKAKGAGAATQKLITCILTNAGALGSKVFFFPVPATLLKTNLAAVKAIA